MTDIDLPRISTLEFAHEVALQARAVASRFASDAAEDPQRWAWDSFRVAVPLVRSVPFFRLVQSVEVFALQPGLVRATVSGVGPDRRAWGWVAVEVLNQTIPIDIYRIAEILEVGLGASELSWSV